MAATQIVTNDWIRANKTSAFVNPAGQTNNQCSFKSNLDGVSNLSVKVQSGIGTAYGANQCVQEQDLVYTPPSYVLTCSGTVSTTGLSMGAGAQVTIDVTGGGGVQNVWGTVFTPSTQGGTATMTSKNLTFTGPTITKVRVVLTAIVGTYCTAGITLYGTSLFSGTTFSNGIAQEWNGTINIPTSGATMSVSVTVKA